MQNKRKQRVSIWDFYRQRHNVPSLFCTVRRRLQSTVHLALFRRPRTSDSMSSLRAISAEHRLPATMPMPNRRQSFASSLIHSIHLKWKVSEKFSLAIYKMLSIDSGGLSIFGWMSERRKQLKVSILPVSLEVEWNQVRFIKQVVFVQKLIAR